MVKVNIISGFLGAGKTTLIKKLLTGSVAKEKIILLENEYGEVGVDGSFMKDSGIIVDELNSGCICCTLVGDFQKAVDDLIAKYHPDRLLIEPSGVGKLSEILAAVERAKERHSDLVVTGCATVVDAGKCRMYMKNFGEFFLDQIKTSATVIFSRTQLLSAERIEKSRALVEEQHPGVRIVTTPWDDLSADTLLEVIESGKPMEIHLDDDEDDDDEDEHEHHITITTMMTMTTRTACARAAAVTMTTMMMTTTTMSIITIMITMTMTRMSTNIIITTTKTAKPAPADIITIIITGMTRTKCSCLSA